MPLCYNDHCNLKIRLHDILHYTWMNFLPASQASLNHHSLSNCMRGKINKIFIIKTKYKEHHIWFWINDFVVHCYFQQSFIAYVGNGLGLHRKILMNTLSITGWMQIHSIAAIARNWIFQRNVILITLKCK